MWKSTKTSSLVVVATSLAVMGCTQSPLGSDSRSKSNGAIDDRTLTGCDIELEAAVDCETDCGEHVECAQGCWEFYTETACPQWSTIATVAEHHFTTAEVSATLSIEARDPQEVVLTMVAEGHNGDSLHVNQERARLINPWTAIYAHDGCELRLAWGSLEYVDVEATGVCPVYPSGFYEPVVTAADRCIGAFAESRQNESTCSETDAECIESSWSEYEEACPNWRELSSVERHRLEGRTHGYVSITAADYSAVSIELNVIDDITDHEFTLREVVELTHTQETVYRDDAEGCSIVFDWSHEGMVAVQMASPGCRVDPTGVYYPVNGASRH